MYLLSQTVPNYDNFYVLHWTERLHTTVHIIREKMAPYQQEMSINHFIPERTQLRHPDLLEARLGVSQVYCKVSNIFMFIAENSILSL